MIEVTQIYVVVADGQVVFVSQDAAEAGKRALALYVEGRKEVTYPEAGERWYGVGEDK